jgi:hypothetical protein
VGDVGTILRTTNGGGRWIKQSTETTYGLKGVSSIDAVNITAVGYYGTILRTTTGGVSWVKEQKQIKGEMPSQFTISQNYPNPFNPTSTIEYQIPNQSFVALKIFDLLGREVAVLVNERKDAGNYSVQWNASSFSSGIYLYRLEANGKMEMRKALLIK